MSTQFTDKAGLTYLVGKVKALVSALEGKVASDYIPATKLGANNGVAELDSTGKVPASQLPSYVDDVVEYASRSQFPATGESGKIYIAVDTNLTYRWTGTTYAETSSSLALGETSSTAYRGDRGKIAYDHSQNGDVHVTAAQKSEWDAKQDPIPANTYDAYGAAAAVQTNLTSHVGDTTKHITATERSTWNAKQDAIPENTYDAYGAAAAVQANLTSHIGDTVKHITATERSTWNGKYALPSTGVPKTDLASAVQASLDKADSALQNSDLVAITNSEIDAMFS